MEAKIQQYELSSAKVVQRVRAGEPFAIVGEGFGTRGDVYWSDDVLQVTAWSDSRIEVIAPHTGLSGSHVVYVHRQDITRMSPALITYGPPLFIEFQDAAAPEAPRIVINHDIEIEGPHKIVTLALFDNAQQAIPHATCSLLLNGICVNVMQSNERGVLQWVLSREAIGKVTVKLTTQDGRKAETAFSL